MVQSLEAERTHPPDLRARGPNLSVYGTFDVLNYGDLLFPLLLRDRLGVSEERMRAFSPVGGALAWDDAVTALPIDTAADFAADLHVVGGGNILHDRVTSLSDYANGRFGQRGAYAALWLGAGLIAAGQEKPLAWNAPGVPYPMEPGPAQVLRDRILAASPSVTLRDDASRELWGVGARPGIDTLPDTALDLPALWPAETLRAPAAAAFARHGLTVPERWLALHVNDRYLDGDVALQARQIEALAGRTNALPVLIAIGPCHGDHRLAVALRSELTIPALVLVQPRGLREIAGLIAHATGYVGSSMHGLITALAYGRPAIAVARPRMIKFAGFLDHLGMPERLVRSWAEAVEAAALLEPLPAEGLQAIRSARDRIDAHWARLRGLFGAPLPDTCQAATQELRLWMERQPAPPRDWRAFTTVLQVPASSSAAPADKPFHCSICGGTTMRPDRRLADSLQGHGQRCASCNSTARHRAMHQVLDQLRKEPTLRASGLQYGRHRVAAGGWFADFALLHPAHEDGRLAPPPADRRFAMVICLDVLEDVRDPGAALAALAAATAEEGVLLLSFRTVPGRGQTLDWGFARGDEPGCRRAFGEDVVETLKRHLPDAHLTVLRPADPHAGSETMLCLITWSAARHAWIAAQGLPGAPMPAAT
ncbi:polysaccharide pyruvyl transferase family protein [Aurantimonas sp. 22II-16-19i]|uniref:polysaccharide pyruvyl transferase family protein n=1 Tax=Aurantimonas sp. 22II-16-19i TaxID=1317114 RepID=UPI0009F7AACC|nr:polysaccharide pyruvyl transferase family protein [Aurantimonas sp. 22II-16-19i]ORE97481.1 hypothetical protein ATO4_09182 [Aurantimonas sp. 22II-16-19i]